ncbi:MAG: hypothetical protein IJI41_07565 [Anaerolineaceae bacterium]|nr:hypothetical protein [Anaerolineaceae bacterium]
MTKSIQMLDVTLRDGAYITNGKFGIPALKGIIKKIQESNIEIIECGWLKNDNYVEGSSYFHVPSDLLPFIPENKNNTTYVVMIDWDRYELNYLPMNDGCSIDAIRVVFPYGKAKDAAKVANEIKRKGYQVYFQIANTLAYSNDDLIELSNIINNTNPVSVSVVDTFGAMYEEDLERIVFVLDKYINKKIKLGFHSHNNQQLAFALTKHFVDILKNSERDIILDSSLCGMGRGAGNATTELVASFLNRKHHGAYDMNAIMDAIDLYMEQFKEKYSWGYSTPYMIAGMYCCHVNNIAYLLENHRASAKDIKNIIESLSPDDRKKYNYDLLEQKFLQNQSHHINDENYISELQNILKYKKVLLIAPGKSSITERSKINKIIKNENPFIIGVNAILSGYDYDFVFFVNKARYTFAREVYTKEFEKFNKILLSNIKTTAEGKELVINYERVIKRGWPHFDNAVITCLRLLHILHVKNILIAGFDGFKTKYNESYADESLPTLNPDNNWDELNEEILSMYQDFLASEGKNKNIQFVTESYFNK